MRSARASHRAARSAGGRRGGLTLKRFSSGGRMSAVESSRWWGQTSASTLSPRALASTSSSTRAEVTWAR